MLLALWAQRNGVSTAAFADLMDTLGIKQAATATGGQGMSEAAVTSRMRLVEAGEGARLFRNNVGAYQDDSGRWVRYGLANDSKAMNSVLKSSDWIGIKPRVIVPADVGHTVGIFTAREVKEQHWQYSGTPREVAQLNFINLVNALGGDARFISEV